MNETISRKNFEKVVSILKQMEPDELLTPQISIEFRKNNIENYDVYTIWSVDLFEINLGYRGWVRFNFKGDEILWEVEWFEEVEEQSGSLKISAFENLEEFKKCIVDIAKSLEFFMLIHNLQPEYFSFFVTQIEELDSDEKQTMQEAGCALKDALGLEDDEFFELLISMKNNKVRLIEDDNELILYTSNEDIAVKKYKVNYKEKYAEIIFTAIKVNDAVTSPYIEYKLFGCFSEEQNLSDKKVIIALNEFVDEKY